MLFLSCLLAVSTYFYGIASHLLFAHIFLIIVLKQGTNHRSADKSELSKKKIHKKNGINQTVAIICARPTVTNAAATTSIAVRGNPSCWGEIRGISAGVTARLYHPTTAMRSAAVSMT